MKLILFVTGVLLFFGLTLAQDEASVGKISFQIGNNFVQPVGKTDWTKAGFNKAVFAREKLKTEKLSRCEVTFMNKKVLRVGENSIIEITKDQAGAEEVTMKQGSAWLSVLLPKGQGKVKVKTPSSVCAIRGTIYRLECDSNQTTYRCYDGALDITPFDEDGTLADSSFQVGAGEELILVMDFEQYKKQQEKLIRDAIKKDMDDFERFKQQDQQQFDNMLKKDLADFQKVNDINYKQSLFNKKDDLNSDWVQWNMERDKLLNQ
jgi:hypothetical protein